MPGVGNLRASIRFRNENAPVRQLLCGPKIRRRDDDLDRGPTVAHSVSELAVHRAWHIDINEYHSDIFSPFQNSYRVVRVSSRNSLKSSFVNQCDSIDLR